MPSEEAEWRGSVRASGSRSRSGSRSGSASGSRSAVAVAFGVEAGFRPFAGGCAKCCRSGQGEEHEGERRGPHLHAPLSHWLTGFARRLRAHAEVVATVVITRESPSPCSSRRRSPPARRAAGPSAHRRGTATAARVAERVAAIVFAVHVDDHRVAAPARRRARRGAAWRRNSCSAARCRRRRRRARPRGARSWRGCRLPRARSRSASGRACRSPRRDARTKRGDVAEELVEVRRAGEGSQRRELRRGRIPAAKALIPPSPRSMCAIGGAGGPASIGADVDRLPETPPPAGVASSPPEP